MINVYDLEQLAAGEPEDAVDRVREYELAGEPDGCYHCGSNAHKTSDCHPPEPSVKWDGLCIRCARHIGDSIGFWRGLCQDCSEI